MTVKLALLKSGENIISDIQEMVVDERVIGFFFNKGIEAIYFEVSFQFFRFLPGTHSIRSHFEQPAIYPNVETNLRHDII